MLRSIPFHPNMNLNLSFNIFENFIHLVVRRWTRLRQCQHSREFNAYWYRIFISAATVFTSFNFHIFRFSSFRFSGKGDVDVYRMCMCFIVSIPCHGIRSSRHQPARRRETISPPTNSPPRNHHATNQLAAK